MSKIAWLTAALSLAIGCAIGFVDSRPAWDDTGITAGSIFLAIAVVIALAGAGIGYLIRQVTT